jgi:hypothetical protein
MSVDLDKLPGLKERALARLGPCVVCGKPLLEGGDVTFYVIKIERAGWMKRALERRAGLAMVIGNDAIARAMGPDEDLAKVIDGPCEVVLHESCAPDLHHPLELMRERAPAAAAEEGAS